MRDPRFLELRRQILDDRAAYLDLWLGVAALFLTILGIGIPILASRKSRDFRRIERDSEQSVRAVRKHISEAEETLSLAKKSAKSALESAQEATQRLERIKQIEQEADAALRNTTAQKVMTRPDSISGVAQVLRDSKVSLEGHVISAAVAAQRDTDYEAAIEKWHATAILAQRKDPRLAARAWFSVGFIREVQEDGRKFQADNYDRVLEAYDASIRADAEYADAYFNRGNVRAKLRRYAEAIEDYTMSIDLGSTAKARYNRGNTHFAMSNFELCLDDYDVAHRIGSRDGSLKTEHIIHNRANALLVLGKIEEARKSLEQAVGMYPESEPLRRNYRFLESICELDSRQRVQTRTQVMGDGRMRLCIDLQDSAGIARLSVFEPKSNFGNVGSTGSMQMPGGEGGPGSAGIVVSPYDECEPT